MNGLTLAQATAKILHIEWDLRYAPNIKQYYIIQKEWHESTVEPAWLDYAMFTSKDDAAFVLDLLRSQDKENQ